MYVNKADHLPKSKRIQLGSYYTPKKLVNRVHSFIQPYLQNKKKEIVIFDSAGGCGAFLEDFTKYDYRIADCDTEACQFLKQSFDINKIFCTNSLIDVSRNKYSIPSSAFLIMIGNPPYNDTTSEFKNGEKGRNICDEDLFDRDLGISFLKSYSKLEADLVCVLHPLSYLIKQSNFKRLHYFKDNYQLIKADIFSSALFSGTGSGKFPILVALYEKNQTGMTFDYIRSFRFNILDSDKTFVLSNYQTTDGYIHKYPPRKNDIKKSPLGLYYYTFRDLNSLKKNTSFMLKEHYNGIVINLENFYKYAYLYSLKKLFAPKDAWLYGNLSPLVNIDELEKNKSLYVLYAIKTNPVLRRMRNQTLQRILHFYGIDSNNIVNVNNLERKIKAGFSKLV